MCDLSPLDAQLRAARQGFLAALGNYDIRGEQLETRCLQFVERYIAPEEDRAPELQEAAHDSVRLIKQFSSTRASLASDVALTSMALEMYVLHLTRRVIEENVKRLGTGEAADCEQYCVAAKWAAELGIKSIEIAMQCLTLRASLLAEYLGEQETWTATQIVDAMLNSANEIARERVKEAVVTTLLPGSQFFLAALAYMKDVRKRLGEIRDYRGRGADDAMFDFRRDLREQAALIESLRSSIHENHSALMAETKPR